MEIKVVCVKDSKGDQFICSIWNHTKLWWFYCFICQSKVETIHDFEIKQSKFFPFESPDETLTLVNILIVALWGHTYSKTLHHMNYKILKYVVLKAEHLVNWCEVK